MRRPVAQGTLMAPVLLGVMAAARSQSVVAVAAWGRFDRRLASPLGRLVASMLAAGEVVGDKLPFVPDRTAPGPLFGRMAFGAFAAVLHARHVRAPLFPAAVAGALAAGVATFTLHRVRRWLGRHTPLPDVAWAVGEDALVVVLARAVLRRSR